MRLALFIVYEPSELAMILSSQTSSLVLLLLLLWFSVCAYNAVPITNFIAIAAAAACSDDNSRTSLYVGLLVE